MRPPYENLVDFRTPTVQTSTSSAAGGLLLVVGLIAALGAAAGVGLRATYGARTTADEPQYLLTALSLASDGDLDIADELAAERWRAFHAAPLPSQTRPLEPDGRHISPHDPLLPLLIAPAVGLAGWVGAKLTLAVLAGVLAALLVLTAVHRLGVRPAIAVPCVGVFALSAPLAVYGTQVYPELPAALAVTVAIASLTGSLRRAGLWMLAAAVVALPWLALKYAPVAAALALVGLARLVGSGRGGAAAGLGAGLAAAGLVFLAVHQAIWTGWTPYASADHFAASGEFGAVGFAPDYWGRSRRLIGLLVDRAFGLAAWQPAWLAALPALGALARRRPPGTAALAAPLAAGWLTATFVAVTMQGWWFPGRQVVAVLPAAVLAIAWAADRSPALLRTVIVLGAIGILSYAWLVVETSTGALTLVVDFFATANPLYRAWSGLLPDYLDVTSATWVLHGAWLAVAAALVGLGWGAVRPRRTS
jgi:hypothetical protein